VNIFTKQAVETEKASKLMQDAILQEDTLSKLREAMGELGDNFTGGSAPASASEPTPLLGAFTEEELDELEGKGGKGKGGKKAAKPGKTKK
jgi:hypothetical protein